MPPTLIDSGRTEVRTSWLGKHPIAGSVAIAALTGVALQLTHMIDFQDRVAALVGWNVSVRFVDFGFRMVLGAVVVLGLLPRLFGYVLRRRNEHILVNGADRDLVLGSPRTLVDSVVDLLEIRPEVSLTSDDALGNESSMSTLFAGW